MHNPGASSAATAAIVCGAIVALALDVAACSPGHTLLRTRDSAQDAEREPGQVDAPADASAEGGVQAPDVGAPQDSAEQRSCRLDDDCPMGMLCQDVCTPCSRVATPCPAGSLQTITTVNGCLVLHCEAPSCTRPEDCPVGFVCWRDKCTACDEAPDGSEKPCSAPWSQSAVLRNGCMRYECFPPKGCTKDTDCASGNGCQAGAHCEPGGEGDTSRCWGNVCAPGSCGGLAAVSKHGELCSTVGCASGLFCETKCSNDGCVCDTSLKQWVCSASCGHCTTY